VPAAGSHERGWRPTLRWVDGIHDLGGLDGFGPVEHVAAEPVFAEDWERRAVRVMLAVNMAVQPGGGAFRHSIERMDPAHYLTSSYYEHWLTGVATLAVEAGLTTLGDLESRAGGVFVLARADRGCIPPGPHEGRTVPKFAVGDRVLVRDLHPFGHTRAPRYVQGRRGVVTRVDGAFSFPDLEAHGGGRVLDPTYSVRFPAAELWGEGGSGDESVNVDLWERYLEPEA
jgi:nitrile hydratase subunit beta